MTIEEAVKDFIAKANPSKWEGYNDESPEWGDIVPRDVNLNDFEYDVENRKIILSFVRLRKRVTVLFSPPTSSVIGTGSTAGPTKNWVMLVYSSNGNFAPRWPTVVATEVTPST